METCTYTLPAHWASALINGDFTGLDEADEEAETDQEDGDVARHAGRSSLPSVDPFQDAHQEPDQ